MQYIELLKINLEVYGQEMFCFLFSCSLDGGLCYLNELMVFFGPSLDFLFKQGFLTFLF